MKNLKTLFVSSLFVSAACSQAVVLTENTWTPLGGDTRLAGTVVADDLTDFSLANGVTGQVQNRVVRAADDTLFFTWRVIRTDSISSLNIREFRLGNFFTPVYDADWVTNGLGSQPANFAFLFDLPGGFVNFRFSDTVGGSTGIVAGEDSYFFYLKTDATEFDRSGVFDVGASDITYSEIFSTYAPVPEPATMTMLGLGALALIRKRRASAAK